MVDIFQVHGNGEDIGAETLYGTGEHLVLQLSAKVLQIQSRIQDGIQGAGKPAAIFAKIESKKEMRARY